MDIPTNKEISMQTMEKKIQSLTLKDRCDRCKAQAFVAAKGFEGELLFCGHHYAKHEEALTKWAYEIIDERDFINHKSESSA
jgi:hypothetical protein